MKYRLFMVALLSLVGVLFGDIILVDSEARWICYPEVFSDGIGKPRYFRKEFDVMGGLKSARLHFWLDDTGHVTVSDSKVRFSRKMNQNVEGFDMTGVFSSPGRHVLAVEGTNLAATGGIIMKLDLVYEDGVREQVFTDTSWRCSKELVSGWDLVGFDDSGWSKAKSFADALASPWHGIKDMRTLLTDADLKYLREAEAKRASKIGAILSRLAGESKPVCRIVYDRGKPEFDIGGKRYETLYYNTTEHWSPNSRRFAEQIEGFRQAGIHLYGLGVEPRYVWKPDGSIDFAAIDELLSAALMMDEDAYFMFCISTYAPPRWWVEANRDELIGYANAIVDFKLSSNHVTKNLPAPSYASLKWRRDIGEVQKRIVEHIEASPYGKRVFAYRTDYGVNHEWHYYGMFKEMPDTGKAMTTHFRKWLRERYKGDVTALRRAWNDADVTFETAEVPDAKTRLRTSAGMLRDPRMECQVIDYLRCHHEVVRDQLLYCNRIIKEACGGRALVGNYCGYFFSMPFPAEGWHLEEDAILDSPYVDFQSSPFIYGNDARRLGEPQYARCLMESFRSRGKLAIMEADNQPHHVGGTYCHYASNEQETLAILARDFVQTLTWGCGFWYFDFGSAWYSRPYLREYFKKLLPIRGMDVDNSSSSDIVVVGDYESVMFANIAMPTRLSNTSITAQVRELGHAGVAFDTCSFADLASGRLKDYKMYLFPNLYYVTEEKRAVIRKLQSEGKIVLWLFASGWLTENGASVESMSALTGMNVEVVDATVPSHTRVTATNELMESYERGKFSPLFHIVDSGSERLGTLKHEGREYVTYGFKNGNYLCTTPVYTRGELRRLFAKHGVHVYNDDNALCVYANRSFVAVHSAKGGRQTIRLPEKSNVTMVYPERKELGRGVREFSFELDGVSTVLFHCDPVKK